MEVVSNGYFISKALKIQRMSSNFGKKKCSQDKINWFAALYHIKLDKTVFNHIIMYL